jgi:citronellol/citronellal dehydrogenase
MGALEGKIAVVTGASRGVGEYISVRFGAEGATVVCTSRTVEPGSSSEPGSLRETVDRIAKLGGKAVAVRCDVSDPASRAAMVAEVLERFGRIDILVNNAAADSYGIPFDQQTEEQWNYVFEINVRAPFDLIRRVVPGMRERGQGWILNISSRTSDLPAGPPYSQYDRGSGVLVYGTSKAALNRLTAGLAAELDGSGVAVNVMMPISVVWTPGVARLGMAQYRNSPLWSEEPAEAMAEAALALCTGDPHVVTGLVVRSTEYLGKIGRTIRTLDGRSELGEWKPVVG